MPATIELYGRRAIVANRTWEVSGGGTRARVLVGMLNASLPESGGSDPDPDGNAAAAAVAWLNRYSQKAHAKIVSRPKPQHVPGRVY